MERVLITGGAGFIGSNLARYLERAGYEAHAVDDLSLGRPENLPDSVALYVGDIAEAGVWEKVPPTDVVVHLAGASSAPMFADNLLDCFRNNILGFIRVLDYARQGGSRRVLYASTSSIYGNVTPPLREDGPVDIPNFYSVSKYSMEQVARMYHLQYELDVVGFRFMSVYGPREDHKGRYANLVSQFIWEAEAGRSPTIYGDGEQTRDFTNVGDIAQAITRAVAYRESLGHHVFNIGTGQATSVNDLVALLDELMEVPVRAQHIENPIKKGYVREQMADIEKTRRTLGYEPAISLRDGIVEILQVRKERAAPR
jgi:UDP-glucose 4-epimerase